MKLLLTSIVAAGVALPPLAQAESRLELSVFGGLSQMDSALTREERVSDCGAFGATARTCFDVLRLRRTSLGPSVTQGAALGYRLGQRGVVELLFASSPSHNLREETETHCDNADCQRAGYEDPGLVFRAFDGPAVPAYHVDLSYRHALLAGEARPYFTAGLGWVEYEGASAGDWSANVGAGVELTLGDRLNARIEAVDHVMTTHFVSGKTAHNVHVRVGLSVRP